MIWWVLGLLLLWVLFNWLAPYSVVLLSRRMHIGNLPGEILYQANASHVRFYRAKIEGGYAFAAWCWPFQIVVMNDEFLADAPPSIIRYVLAHELGHCVLGHSWRKWVAVVTGFIFLPSAERWITKNEDKADDFAERLSGVPRTVVRGVRRMPEDYGRNDE